MIKTLTRRGLLQTSAVAAALALGLTAPVAAAVPDRGPDRITSGVETEKAPAGKAGGTVATDTLSAAASSGEEAGAALDAAFPVIDGVGLLLDSAGALLARAGTAQFDWAVVVPFTLAAVAGSLGGKKITDRVSGATLTRAFAVLLIGVAVYTATASLISLFG